MKKKLFAAIKDANRLVIVFEQCERNIQAGINPDYFKAVKAEAEEKLAEEVKTLSTLFLQCSKKEVCTLQS